MSRKTPNITEVSAKLANAPLSSGRDAKRSQPICTAQALPDKFTYALSSFTAELRNKGWYIAKTVPSFADRKPEWAGPFETIETVVLAIGRRLATEIADRHTRMIETHKIAPGAPLYGLKKTTRLRQAKKAKGSVA